MRLSLSIVAGFILAGAVQGQDDDFLRQAREAWMKGDNAKAVELAGKAIDKDPKNAHLYLIRGQMYEADGQHVEAVKDFDKCLELDARLTEAHDHRGSERFKLGKVAEALADFDRYI